MEKIVINTDFRISRKPYKAGEKAVEVPRGVAEYAIGAGFAQAAKHTPKNKAAKPKRQKGDKA